MRNKLRVSGIGKLLLLDLGEGRVGSWTAELDVELRCVEEGGAESGDDSGPSQFSGKPANADRELAVHGDVYGNIWYFIAISAEARAFRSGRGMRDHEEGPFLVTS
jgi:hypothetical protein